MHINIKLITLLLVSACLAVSKGSDASYSTDATVSLQKDEGTLNVDVRVSRLVEQDGRSAEQLVAAPKIKTAPGVTATLYTGLQPIDPNYAQEENVSVDVSWPYPNESGTGFCLVTIKRGSQIVSKSRLQLKVEGPGRLPLILAVQDVDPKSVRVAEEKSQSYVLLELAGKTRQEVKKLATENYGNKVQVRDRHGRLIEGGLSFGTYHEIGLALQCKGEDEAKQVASILRGEGLK
jgi:hypothetical protein